MYIIYIYIPWYVFTQCEKKKPIFHEAIQPNFFIKENKVKNSPHSPTTISVRPLTDYINISTLFIMLKKSLILAVFAVGCFHILNTTTTKARSLTLSVIKYFSRPHTDIPTGPVVSSAAWYGPSMLDSQGDWLLTLSDCEVNVLRGAVSTAVASNKSLNALTLEDFPLGNMASNASAWRKALSPELGAGVVVLRGLPVQTWSSHELEILWWGIGLHIGIPGAQNGQGDLLGRVSDEFFGVVDGGDAVGKVRQYRTSEKIEFHCDPADVVGLFCLRTAGQGGGRSRIASSVTIFNELYKQHPDLIPLLFEPLAMDARGDGGITWFPITPCAYSNGVLRCFWHTVRI